MSNKAIGRAALADPDAQPLSAADFERMQRTAQAKIAVQALRLSRQEPSAEDRISPLFPKTR